MQLLKDLTEDLEERPVADDADDLVGVAVGGDAVCCGDVLVDGVPEREAAHVVLRAVTLCTSPTKTDLEQMFEPTGASAFQAYCVGPVCPIMLLGEGRPVWPEAASVPSQSQWIPP